MIDDGVNREEVDVEQVRREGSFKQFDAICDVHRIEPADLPGQKDETLVAWVLEQTPEKLRHLGADPRIVRRMLAEYVAECE